MKTTRALAALISVFLGTAYCATLRDADEGVCVYEGKMYPVGDFQAGPCSPCMCQENGNAYCAVVDCFFNGCVDFEYVEDQCCPVCPNGPNCLDFDGNIVMGNETVTLPSDDGEGEKTCNCELSGWSQAFVCRQLFENSAVS